MSLPLPFVFTLLPLLTLLFDGELFDPQPSEILLPPMTPLVLAAPRVEVDEDAVLLREITRNDVFRFNP
jgi:hypothetical protein